MRDPNPDESLDAEGVPGDLFDQPPGIDVETEGEGIVAPRDHSIAAGSDPAYPVTANENARPESVAERAAREAPEAGAPSPRPHNADPAVTTGEEGYLGTDAGTEDEEDEEVADTAEPEGRRALSPEEAAVHVAGEDAADDRDPARERAEYLEP